MTRELPNVDLDDLRKPAADADDVERVARAICKSRTCEGVSCCQWPANGGRTKCPVKDGGYDDAARDAIAAFCSAPPRDRLKTLIAVKDAARGRPLTDAERLENLTAALQARPAQAGSAIKRMAAELAPQLDGLINGILHPHEDLRKSKTAELQQWLWENKVGILRCLQALAAPRAD